MRRERQIRSGLIAVLVATGLHLLLMLAVSWIWPAWAAAPKPIRVVMLDMLEPPPPPPPIIPPDPPPAPAAPPRAARLRRVKPRVAPPPSTPPKAARPRMSLSMRRLDLDLQRDPAGDYQAAAAIERPKEQAPTRQQSEAARVKERVDRLLGDSQARQNARDGRAHPYLFSLLRAADAAFQPDLSMIPKRRRKAMPAYGRAYSAGVKRFMKMGSALPQDTGEMGVVVTPPKLLAGQAEIAGAVQQDGGQRLAAEVCVRTEPGRRPEVVSRRRSGLRAIDRLAEQAVAGAIKQLPGVAPVDLPPGKACYRFGVAFGRALPQIGLNLAVDLVKGIVAGDPPGAEWLTRRVGLTRLYLRQAAAGRAPSSARP